MKLFNKTAAAFLLLPLCGWCVELEVVLPPTAVHDADNNGFVSPLAWNGRQLFSGSVVPPAGKETGINLQTLVRQGQRDRQGVWRWQETVIDRNTLNDKWHNSPSLGLDRDGYLHVAYNMHNMPWQYMVSQRPGDIRGFLFRGQGISEAERRTVQYDVRYPFNGSGTASIPGNQVTYPVFFNAPDGRLYLTYRYAMRPKLGWFKRSLAGGLAVYSEASRSWQQLGGKVAISSSEADHPNGLETLATRPVIYEEGWTFSPIQLAFDAQGGMHMTWLWRQGTPGREFVQPSYAWSPNGGQSFHRSDGSRYKLPISRAASEKLVADQKQLFLGLSRITASPGGELAVLLHPIDGNRVIMERRAGRWQRPAPAPFAAQQLVYDRKGWLWAFASGLQVLRRDRVDDRWQHLVKGEGGMCHPQVLPTGQDFMIFMRGCDTPEVAIFRLQTGT